MTNQIIEVPDIAVVKTVEGAKKLLSLRDQKIKKDKNLHNFGAGSGVEYQGDLYVLDSGMIPIVTMVTLNTNLSFMVSANSDIEVDWGDGTREKNVFSHMYIDGASKHEILFYGTNTALKWFHCRDSQLTKLDVSLNTALIDLNCGNNQLTLLDVSQNKALLWLYCQHNQLTQLDVSQNTALTWLSCKDNQLTQLDVTHNTGLTILFCGNNQLTQLYIAHNTALERLYCNNNQLTQLDVSQSTALEIFDCGNNQLTQLNVNTGLRAFYCSNNQLTQLDVAQNKALTALSCENNPLIIDQSSLTALANSWQRIGQGSRGTLTIDNPAACEWIVAICDAKNWGVL